MKILKTVTTQAQHYRQMVVQKSMVLVCYTKEVTGKNIFLPKKSMNRNYFLCLYTWCVQSKRIKPPKVGLFVHCRLVLVSAYNI